jgi:hypothetical protein
MNCQNCNIILADNIPKTPVKDIRHILTKVGIQVNWTDNGFICGNCHNQVFEKNAVGVYNYFKLNLSNDQFTQTVLNSGLRWVTIAQNELQKNPTNQSTITTNEKELERITLERHDEFKAHWNKDKTVQFKNDKIAILRRHVGGQVQFIVAFDQVTREGFKLMAIDEGKSIDGGAGITGGISSFYYFQKVG